ncbi:MAG: hypothetical protein KIT35_11230 [Piscinibacter sp.]|uniref:hypothetical protein n=1 Tax=Piscinibacter sp. TaxID=1903157 RepID=UPI0025839489|nr:hypothetical protein [Piscinibacter sp.]MCW5664396.1 hypothetical protein [Piscinibacter sp.]
MTTTRGLLQTLGLGPRPGPGPTGPLKKPGGRPREELPAPKKASISDAEIADALKKLPADPRKQGEALADLVTRIGDAARRDPIVRKLRDAIVKVQPVLPDAEARKKIDKAIDDLVEKGIKEGIKALLTVVVGKAPTEVNREQPKPQGPSMDERDLKERILKSPELPLPFDKPPKLRRNAFEFLGLARSYKASKYFDFKLRTPDWFQPGGKLGAGWVVIGAKDEFDKTGGRPSRLRDKRIDSRGELSMSLAAPDEPGRYVVFVVVGSGPENHPVHEFEVTT